MILDRASAVPLYFQIYQHLLEQIQSGALQPGQTIPSEPELASSLGISRMTARQAVKALCDAGVTYSRRGLGTFVSGNKQEKTSTELLSFTQETQASGSQPASRVLAFEEVGPGPGVVSALHLGPKAKVFRIKRIRMADKVPMSIEESFLPAKLCPRLLEIFDPGTSLYQILSQSYGLRMTAADEVAEASLAKTEEAGYLQIKKGSPVFVLTRISYAESGQPIEFVRSVYRGDRWKLVSRLTTDGQAGANRIVRKPVAVSGVDSSSHRQAPQAELDDGTRTRTFSNLTHPQEEP